MILPINLYRKSEEQSLRDICAICAKNAKLVEKEKRRGLTGGTYTCYEIEFGEECTVQDRTELIEALRRYEIAKPGVWNVPE